MSEDDGSGNSFGEYSGEECVEVTDEKILEEEGVIKLNPEQLLERKKQKRIEKLDKRIKAMQKTKQRATKP